MYGEFYALASLFDVAYFCILELGAGNVIICAICGVVRYFTGECFMGPPKECHYSFYCIFDELGVRLRDVKEVC